MCRKIASLILALMLMPCMTAVAASAAQIEISENAAAAPAEVGAEAGADTGAEAGSDTGAEAGTDTGDSGTKIYFDASTTGWNNYSIIMVYLYELESGDVVIDWASRKKGGMTDEGSNIWSYDFGAKGIELSGSIQYGLIFNADTGAQTCDLIFDTSCYGDTAYCEEGNMLENTADSNKKSVVVRWRNHTNLGPVKAITSLGHIVGEVVPAHTTPYKMFVKFLASLGKDGLQNALNYSNGKTAQQIIDETASDLGLKKDDVKQAIAEAAKEDPDSGRSEYKDWSSDWDESKSSLPEGTNEEIHSNPVSGITDTPKNQDSTESKSDNTKTNTSTGGSSSGGSSTSGSGSGATTGQETTVLFIMIGVMVAAIAVIIILRIKNRNR